MIVSYQDDARQELLKGAEKLYNAVKTTFGPRGCNVLVHHLNNIPIVTHDGVTVAESFRSLDRSIENTGVELIKSAASKMNQIGDGTTTVTVLTYHLLKAANRLITGGHNPMELKRQLDTAVTDVLEQIDEFVEKIESKERLEEIATISAGDPLLGKIVADVVHTVGINGMVTVEKTEGFEITHSTTNGFKVDYGFGSPLMSTDQRKMVAEYKSANVLIVKKRLTSIIEIIPFLERFLKAGKKELLIVAEAVEGEALANLVHNKQTGAINVVSVNVPGYQTSILEDIAQLTGATIVSAESGVQLKDVELEHLGSAGRVIVDKESLTIGDTPGNVAEKVESVKESLKNAKDRFEKREHEQRLARLTGSIGVIRVGGATETEIEEKKYRLDDAVAAAQSALRGGIVPGAGVTYLNACRKVSSGEFNFASEMLAKVLEQPARLILENAGLEAGEWMPKIKDSKDGYGIDITKDNEIIDLKANGVVDPAEVTKEALKTAASIAGNVLTTGAALIEERLKEDE